MAKKEKEFNPRAFMELAVEVMKKSVQEPRNDKASPKVGAVLVKPNGQVETAFRGELREGDHAEFTLLERKNRSESVEGGILFATLEPCAPGARKHPKLGCAERIVNARIKEIWIGVEDPDPMVDRKGIQYLIDSGIEVHMFDVDLQAVIWAENAVFKQQAEERAKKAKEEKKEIILTEKERGEPLAQLMDFSEEEVLNFINEANLDVEFKSNDFIRVFNQLGFTVQKGKEIVPTGIGLLLFGKRPQLLYQNALIRATYKSGDREEIATVEGPLTQQADKIRAWYESKIGTQIDRTHSHRLVNYDFPLIVLREAVVNAIVHRDYDIEGAPIYFEINDDAIIVKSPGAPVAPLTFEQIKSFSAPSLSRNPKIMYAFDQLKLVEQRGLGFKTIKDLPGKFHLPLPVVSYQPPYVVMAFPRSNEAFERVLHIPGIGKLNDEEIAGYQWITISGAISSREYANHFNYGYKKAQRQLSKMKSLKLIEDNGLPSNSPNYRYKVTADNQNETGYQTPSTDQ